MTNLITLLGLGSLIHACLHSLHPAFDSLRFRVCTLSSGSARLLSSFCQSFPSFCIEYLLLITPSDFTGDGDVRIGDFGLARPGDYRTSVKDPRTATREAFGSFTKEVGTASYVAPEVRSAGNGKYNEKADVSTSFTLVYQCSRFIVPQILSFDDIYI